MVSRIQDTLKSRAHTHGEFSNVADASQAIKEVIVMHTSTLLSCGQTEALEMISTKIARIICGNPDHKDSWHDIAGYALLAEELIP